jgi:streptogramin lyase
VYLALLVLLVAGAPAAWKLWPRRVVVIEYPMTVATDIPTAVAVAPDGSVWFTIDFGEGIGVVRDGRVQRIPKKGRNVEPIGLGVDASGAVWFTDPSAIAVLRMTPSGELQPFPLGTPIARLARLAVAPDGAVWFAEGTAYSITRLKDGVLQRQDLFIPHIQAEHARIVAVSPRVSEFLGILRIDAARRRHRLDACASALALLDPDATLARGFSIVRDAAGRIVRDSRQLQPESEIGLRFAHGTARATVSQADE